MTQDAPQEKTQRLFVAIEVPDAVRQLLADQQKGLSGVRWTSPENLHLTVRFIGEAASAQASAIKTGLRSVCAERFSLLVAGLGFFDKRPQAVVWAGVEKSAGLAELRRQVNEALENYAGLKAPDGGFSPHITLGRAKQADRKALRAFTSTDGAALKAEFAVKSFTLFSSVLAPGGAVHTVEQRFPLAANASAAIRTT